MKKLLLFLFFAGVGFCQTNSTIAYVTVAPSGACATRAQMRLYVPSGVLYSCQAGTWAVVGGGGGGGSTPVTVLHSLSVRSSGTPASLVLTNFASGNIVVIFLDGEGSTATEPTISWSDATTSALAGSGLTGGRNATTYVATLASSAPTVSVSWPMGASFAGILAVEFPVSLVKATIDATGSAKNCCNSGNESTAVVLTTTVSDIVVSSIGLNSSNDYALCPPSMMPAGRGSGNDAAYMCFGVAPQAVTGLPVGFTVITDATNAMQSIALKHQ